MSEMPSCRKSVFNVTAVSHQAVKIHARHRGFIDGVLVAMAEVEAERRLALNQAGL